MRRVPLLISAFDWNRLNIREDIKFILSVQEAPGVYLITDVDLRYDAEEYQDFLSTETWLKLNDAVESMSLGTMFIVTNERLFRRGIISIKVACFDENYQKRLVYDVIRWINDIFLPD